MEIRPLHKTIPGNYLSNCKEWLFIKKESSLELSGWYVYQRMPDHRFHKDTPYFYYPYRTIKELIKALEKSYND